MNAQEFNKVMGRVVSELAEEKRQQERSVGGSYYDKMAVLRMDVRASILVQLGDKYPSIRDIVSPYIVGGYREPEERKHISIKLSR